MKTKLLTATILLCMLAICQDVFAQANRKRKMDTKEVYCTCGTKISKNTYKDGEYMYYCPNLQCRSVWSIKVYFGKNGFDMPKIGEPVFKGRYKLPQDKGEKKAIHKHKCGKSCINAFFDEKTNMIIINRAGKCNEIIYIAFPSLKMNYLLSENEDKGFFYINRKSISKELLNYTCTNDKSFFYKKYGGFTFITHSTQ